MNRMNEFHQKIEFLTHLDIFCGNTRAYIWGGNTHEWLNLTEKPLIRTYMSNFK